VKPESRLMSKKMKLRSMSSEASMLNCTTEKADAGAQKKRNQEGREGAGAEKIKL